MLRLFSGQTPTGTGVIRHPDPREFELEVTTGVALAALAVGLSLFVIVAFVYLWRKTPQGCSKGDKAKASTSSRVSNAIHSGESCTGDSIHVNGARLVLFSALVVLSIVNVSGITAM
jgi:hypothetical protein